MLTYAIVSKLLDYQSDSGLFFWRCSTYRRGRPGERAGGLGKRGYWWISLYGRKYQASRIAWLLMTKKRPWVQIDHKNLNRSDDRWANLRLATQSQNMANGSLRKDNKSGYRGVSWNAAKKCWVARISNRYLGYFSDKETAAKVYDAAAAAKFGEYARLNFKKEEPLC